MAKIGLKYLVYALATETSSAISYSSGAVLAKAIKANIAVTVNDAKLYADDAIAETDKSFISGLLTLDIDRLSDAIKVALLGYTEGADLGDASGSNELSVGSTTIAPNVGVGFYAKVIRDNAAYYRAVWVKKVQFKEPNDEAETKGESPQFKVPTIEGTIMMAADGIWKEEGTFSTEAGAIGWLNGKAGISSTASNNITALSITNGTLTPSFAEATRLYSCAVSGNVDFTATFAAGTCKLYINGVYDRDLTSTVKSSSITFGAGTNALYELVVQESGKPAVIYKIMMQRA